MNEMKLSKRLETVLSFVPEGSSVADIGSDHAYLPVYACLHDIIHTAIAGEVSDGPFQSAEEQVRKSDLSSKITVRKGDGLEVISPNEVDVITIAGMGGKLIRDILDRGKAKLEGVSRLVLQPNVGAKYIRVWLIDHEWELIDEAILEEDEKIYEVLVAEKGIPTKPYEGLHIDTALLLGPFLMKQKNDIFIKKWLFEVDKWEKVLQQMEQASSFEPELEQRKSEIKQKANMVREVIT